MEYKTSQAIAILERTPGVVEALLRDLPEVWTHSNEGGESWSPFDILGHLIHGERTDWVPRMQLILSDTKDKTFTPFDRFAQFRDSKGKDLGELLATFRALRKRNLELLRQASIDEKTMKLEGTHPALGTVTLQQLLATWVVHDLNHLHQIARCMARQYEGEVGPWREYLGILQRS